MTRNLYWSRASVCLSGCPSPHAHTARSEKKINHDFSHENRHSGTSYIEIAVFVPCRFQSGFQSRFSAQWNTSFRLSNAFAQSMTVFIMLIDFY